MAEKKTAARKFEYQITKFITETDSRELKQLGKDGWELVAINTVKLSAAEWSQCYAMFWKREIFN